MQIILKTDASQSAAFALPFAGFAYLNFFSAPDVMARNLVPGQPQPRIVGAPVQNAGYIRCKGLSDFIDTAQLDTQADLLLAVVCRTVAPVDTSAARNAVMIGNYAASTASQMGANLYGYGATGIRGSAFGASAAVQPTLTAPSTDWAFRAVRVGNSQILVDDLTHGVQVPAGIAGGRSLQNGESFRVGSGYALFAERCDIAGAAIVRPPSGGGTDAQLTALYRRMQAAAARHGIVV